MAGIIIGPSFREVLKHTANYDLDAAGLKLMLLRSDFSPNPDNQFASSYTTWECGATGYAGGFGGAGRKALTGNALTYDTATNTLKFDADDPAAWNPLGGATNQVIGYGAIIREVTNDAASPVFVVVKLASPYQTTGSSFTFQFNAAGIFTYQIPV
jgi:hypothetical protein